MPADALVRGLVAGDEAAGAEAWRQFSTLVRRLLRRGLGPGHEIDDQVQEVFLRLFARASRVREPEALRAFVVGITARVIRKELTARWARRWLLLSPTGVVADVSEAVDDPDGREAVRRLYAVLDGLDATTRTAFVLRHMEGVELAEAAAAVGVSLATVKRRLSRAEARVLASARRDPVLAEYLERDPARTGGGWGDGG